MACRRSSPATESTARSNHLGYVLSESVTLSIGSAISDLVVMSVGGPVNFNTWIKIQGHTFMLGISPRSRLVQVLNLARRRSIRSDHMMESIVLSAFGICLRTTRYATRVFWWGEVKLSAVSQSARGLTCMPQIPAIITPEQCIVSHMLYILHERTIRKQTVTTTDEPSESQTNTG